MTTFKELGLGGPILASLDELGFTDPTPIQAAAIPLVLGSGKDLIALAQTGTGKTAAFGLPVLEQVVPNGRDLQAIILCPTRELCIQISRDLRRYASNMKGLTLTPVYGGEPIGRQIGELRRGTNIVVGTPGRVHDLIRRKVLRLQDIKWLVLDEADEMLDMGFKDDLDAILEDTPSTRRTMLFSATLSEQIRDIAKRYMREYEEVSVGTRNAGAENVSHEYYVVKGRDRYEALTRILDNLPGVYGILFCRTRAETQDIADRLARAHYDTQALHGDVSQGQRTRIMDAFKKKSRGLLVATDVAARGIDVGGLTHVINFSLPDTDSGYTHRSGRTGRASESGVSISIVTAGEARRIKFLQQSLGKRFALKSVPTGDDILRKQVDGWLAEIETADVSKLRDDGYFDEVAERLSALSRTDLIKRFVAHRFSRMLKSGDEAIDAAVRPSGFPVRGTGAEVTLKINFGKRDGLNIKEFFGLINSCTKLRGLDIGEINLGANESTFSIDAKFADEAVSSLGVKNFRGVRVAAELADGSSRKSFGGKGARTRGFARAGANRGKGKHGCAVGKSGFKRVKR